MLFRNYVVYDLYISAFSQFGVYTVSGLDGLCCYTV